MKGKVIAGKVAVEPMEAPSQTEGGMYIPETAKRKTVKAKVVAAGASTSEEKTEVSPGDIILTSVYAGTKFEYERKNYKLINHKDILFIFET
jgi:chaperonin GroES